LSEKLVSFLTAVRKDLADGKGFILFKGLPVERWGVPLSAVAYMGIGTYLGFVLSSSSSSVPANKTP
jgi:hypothetical protein